MSNTNNATSPLIERIFLFLEEENWEKANEYCEKVLDIEPKCAEAYLGKILAGCKISKREQLANHNYPLDDNINYKRIMQFGNDEIKNEVSSYNQTILEKIEENRKKAVYAKAIQLLNANTSASVNEAAKIFESLSEYKDAPEKAQYCKDEVERLQVLEAERTAEEQRIAQEIAEAKAEKAEIAKKKRYKIGTTLFVALGIVVLLTVIIVALTPFFTGFNRIRYNTAISLLEKGELEKSYEIFLSLGEYKDSKRYLQGFHYEYDKVTITYENGVKEVTEYEYDYRGNVVKETIYRYDEQVAIFTHEYDEYGNITNDAYYSGFENEDEYETIYEYEYEYDEDGNITQKTTISDNSTTKVEKYKYDDDGKVIKKTQGDSYTYRFEYDKNGKMTKAVYESLLDDKIIWLYDEHENITKSTYIDAHGDTEVLAEYEYEYDKKGNLLKETGKNYADKYTYTFKYHENGYISEAEYIYDNIGSTIKTFNEKGLPVSYKSKNADGTESIYEYEYEGKHFFYTPVSFEEYYNFIFYFY